MNQIYEVIESYGVPVGRALVGLLFVFSGVGMFLGGIETSAGMIASKNIPLSLLVAWLVVLWKLGAGGALMLGYRTREAALALIVFTVLTILLFHLDLKDVNLFKNLAIIGGLLFMIAQNKCASCNADIKSSSNGPSMAL